jgi:osmotically-inducible protein OsmY
VADAGITSSVRAALTRDPDLRATRVEVETVDGRVALTGEVPSAEARERATQIASAVAGVRSVDNRLKVGTG